MASSAGRATAAPRHVARAARACDGERQPELPVGAPGGAQGCRSRTACREERPPACASRHRRAVALALLPSGVRRAAGSSAARARSKRGVPGAAARKGGPGCRGRRARDASSKISRCRGARRASRTWRRGRRAARARVAARPRSVTERRGASRRGRRPRAERCGSGRDRSRRSGGRGASADPAAPPLDARGLC
jgi:hypothetical protein